MRLDRLACFTALTLLASAALAASPATPRFSGQGNLTPPPARSPDHRFEVSADLLPGNRLQANERFQLDARLAPDAAAKAAAAATGTCAATGDSLFNDGFE